MNPVPITVAEGDGIGPEIMAATLEILEAAGAALNPEFVIIGEKAYGEGITTGVTEQAWGSIACTGILLKAPLYTPSGGGYKSVNVTLRKTLGLFANVRPAKTLTPFVPSKHSGVDVVVVRENEEDLYAGIEYKYSPDYAMAMKLITREGCERIIRYAFEYAKTQGRKRVTALVKDNIMKVTDGMFAEVFHKIAAEYKGITADTCIVDIGMARVADNPADFDVLVTLNLYGDILSDITSQIVGSVGLAGSMNVGTDAVMFEAIHGCAPDIAGQGIANPSGLLNAGLLMLNHIGQGQVAQKVENAWLTTLEQGKVTGDLARLPTERKLEVLNTKEFTKAVIANLGSVPQQLPAATAAKEALDLSKTSPAPKQSHNCQLAGVDVFMQKGGASIQTIGDKISALNIPGLEFECLVSRGVKVYPIEYEAKTSGDICCARFYATNGAISNEIARNLLAAVQQAGFTWVKVETLLNVDGQRAFSLFQGE